MNYRIATTKYAWAVEEWTPFGWKEVQQFAYLGQAEAHLRELVGRRVTCVRTVKEYE